MLNDLRFRLRSLFKRMRADAELDDELRFHIERQIEKGRSAGLTPAQAERMARLQFGALDQVKDECRDARGLSSLETTMQDLRYGLRVLRRSPAFTAIALLLLALGVGVSTAVFSVANQVLLHGLAVKDPSELAQLVFDDARNNIVRTEFSYPAFEFFLHSKAPFSGIFAVSEPIQVNAINQGIAGLASAVFESAAAPSVLGLHPALGRLSNAGDTKATSETPPVFLSYSYWQKRFAGDPKIIGQPITVNALPFVIAGVTPAGFNGVTLGIAPDLILPVYTADAVRRVPTVVNRNSWGFTVICRRKPDVTEQQLLASLQPAFTRALEDFYAGAQATMLQGWFTKLKLRAESASLGANSDTRTKLERPLTILIIITGLVFLIASANLAGLMLSKTARRTAEIGVRLAIGCGRGRLMRQLLTESALLAAIGGACGVFAAFWTGPLLLRLLGGQHLTEAIDVRPDLLTLAFGFVLTVLGAVLPSVAPALHALRVDPQLSIRTSHALAGPERSRFARLLIVAQVAASLVLAMVAAQFVRSLENYEHVNSGFRPDHLITVSVRPGLLKYNGAQHITYAQSVYAQISALPGIKSVSFSTSTFGDLTWNTLVNVPGYRLKGTLDDSVGRNIVGPRFAETLGLTLIAGRDFDTRDTKDSPATVIVNQSFAHHFFGSDDVLGRKVFFVDSPKRPDTIIGVVRDARDRGLKHPPEPVLYSNYEHDPLGGLTFTVRVQQDPKFAQNEIVSVIKRFDPQVPIEKVSTVEVQLDEALQNERMLAVLSAILGTLATLVAMIGLYGLLAYSVTRRTREIGIRMALGARPGQVQWIAVKDGLVLLICGIALGFPLYMAFSRVLQAQVFQVTAEDPAALSMALGLLLLSAAFATCIPAWRSARVNPVEALKCE